MNHMIKRLITVLAMTVFAFAQDYPGWTILNDESGYLNKSDTTFYMTSHPQILFFVKDCDSVRFENCTLITTVPSSGNGNMFVAMGRFDDPCPTTTLKKVVIKNCIIENFSFAVHGFAPPGLIIDSCYISITGSTPYSQGIQNEGVDINYTVGGNLQVTNNTFVLDEMVDHALYISGKGAKINVDNNQFYMDGCMHPIKVYSHITDIYPWDTLTVTNNETEGEFFSSFVLLAGDGMFPHVEIDDNIIDTTFGWRWMLYNTMYIKTTVYQDMPVHNTTPTNINEWIDKYIKD